MKAKLIDRLCIGIAALLTASGMPSTTEAAVTEADVCVYGATSAGVIAAYTTAMSGKSVILIEPGRHVGGMTTGGLGYTDIGNKFVVTGLSRDFYRRIGSHYGQLEQWIFEPSVAESILNGYLERGGINVMFEHRLSDVNTIGNRITEIQLESSHPASAEATDTIRADMFIDCSYEGDLMARSGVSYSVGREDNSVYGETYNGVHVMHDHQFTTPVDPYVIPGDPSSGLLWGINEGGVAPTGSGDKQVQAYCFRICLTDNPDNMIPITRPGNYDVTHYELLARLIAATPDPTLDKFFIWSRMPGNKTDINNRGAFSTDMIGANWEYPDADYSRRAEIWQEHEDYTKGLLYFMGHDPRVPENVRNEMLRWGYPADEYTDNDHWTHQLYIREARRMTGSTVMTEAHCLGTEIVSDPIAWAAYTMDSHNCNRTLIDGVLKNEGDVEIGGFPPFPISYGAIVPKHDEINNLLVPVCLSASHIAYGSIRMEPVFMVLGQVSAIAACEAIDQNCDIQAVDPARISHTMTANPLMDGSEPETVVDNANHDAVTMTGSWTLVEDSKRGYGPNYYVASDPSVPSRIRFTPTITPGSAYDMYLYIPRIQNLSSQIGVHICDGKTDHTVTIHPSANPVLGQAYGEWVNLGRYNAGPGTYVTIDNSGADGSVVADAILLIPDRAISLTH